MSLARSVNRSTDKERLSLGNPDKTAATGDMSQALTELFTEMFETSYVVQANIISQRMTKAIFWLSIASRTLLPNVMI